MSYWKADDHRWGKGHIHLIRPEGGKTLCGVTLSNCPGRHVPEDAEYLCDCRGCLNVLAAQEQRAIREEQWKREQEERDRREQELQKERERQRQEIWQKERERLARTFSSKREIRWAEEEPGWPRSGIAMPFGKYKGMDLADLPEEYLEWLLDQDWLFEDLRMNIEIFLGRY